jgi:hypothetical protein
MLALQGGIFPHGAARFKRLGLNWLDFKRLARPPGAGYKGGRHGIPSKDGDNT